MSIKGVWDAARASGARTFNTGMPCVHGHTADRWTNSGICVLCKRERDNAYNAQHKEAHRRRSRESAVRRADEVRQYQAVYYMEHRDEAIERARVWSESHRERVRDAQRRYHARNADAINEKQRAWRKDNSETAREQDRKWKRANPHKVREADARRRAVEMGARTGDRRAYAAFVKWAREAPVVRCYWCHKPTKRTSRHLDHIVPLARGGADAVENLCVSCASCNIRKNAKLPIEFAGQAEIHFLAREET